MGGAQHGSELGTAARRAIGALGLREKEFEQLTYTKNPRIPSSLNILPMARSTPLPRKEQSCQRAGVALPVPCRCACALQPPAAAVCPRSHHASDEEGSSAPPQPLKKGRVCNDTWDNTQLADHSLNAEFRRALLGFEWIHVPQPQHIMCFDSADSQPKNPVLSLGARAGSRGLAAITSRTLSGDCTRSFAPQRGRCY